jgi:5-hydroxyisourate hydrolase-like protein (transthyretin family)
MKMTRTSWLAALLAALTTATMQASAQQRAALHIEGQVQAGGGPLANSTVTLWAGSANDPKQLAQTTTASDGRFEIGSDETISADVSLYLIAKDGEAAVNRGNG